MRILFLHSSSDLYGASKILLAVTELCQKNSHKVTVVLSENGELAHKLEQTGAEVLILDLGILRRQYLSLQGLINRTITIFKAYKNLNKICKEKQIDLIYSNTTGVIVGIFVATHQKIRHLWHVHEIIEKPYPLFRFLSYLLNKKQNQTIVVSEAVKKHWEKKVQAEKIKVLYNGVDYWLFDSKESSFRAEVGIAPDAIVVGMMGRVHFWKGQDYFLKIAGVLHKTFPKSIFVSVGDAFPGYEYLYDNLNKIIQEEQLQEVVKQIKYRSDIVNIYNALDLFILPSLLPDPAPAVVTEAMACGLPVAITQQGGAVEMIEENISGILLPLNSPVEAAKKIAPLLQDVAARKEMGAQARARIEKHFSRALFNKKIIELIEQAQ